MPQNVSGMSSGHTRRREELKVVIVGDGGCGKTSLLMVYTKKRLSRGREDYDRLRPLSYPNANLVLICYDVNCPSNYDNVLIKWYPEVHHFCHGVPIILVGCKTDLRKDKALARKLWSSGQNPITYIQNLSRVKRPKGRSKLSSTWSVQPNTRRMWRTYSERLPNKPLQQQGNPERQRGTDSVPFCDPRDNDIHHRELLIQTIL
ncbi:rho-related GTP-binding protein RhoF-like [Oncorhynchus keta]|uniref:rho-related GTP-binding protein RhoF-like n=1 Tax=Oncorhynchus keta TaxID=8018 RepID=UPI0015FD4F51|nr:rho-related GTP-binding protein RhoF-like [Oncorhynchus keta]